MKLYIRNRKMRVNIGGVAYDVNASPVTTFTIAGKQYQVEFGMTWGEWFSSEYNTTGEANIGDFAIKYNGSIVNNSDIIDIDKNYARGGGAPSAGHDQS